MVTAVLVLDMLTDFTSGKLANPAAGQIIEPIAALTRAARERDDWLVIYGNDAHRPGDFELAVFGEHAMAGSPGSGRHRPAGPAARRPDRPEALLLCLHPDRSRCHLPGARHQRLVVTGQHTDCCCRHTSYDAFARGIKVTVVSDATAVFEPFAGARYQQAQDDALHYLRTYYGAEVASTVALV